MQAATRVRVIRIIVILVECAVFVLIGHGPVGITIRIFWAFIIVKFGVITYILRGSAVIHG